MTPERKIMVMMVNGGGGDIDQFRDNSGSIETV